ncbi:hypothetical protein CHELA1G11_12815 [Hyphomicrobiales bacterium]|nr:hypothetical protein CHELA1G2_11494 [Hyphomicrobiales bacterium]CAH1667315.1 hypothetical protein CHELA1G11_12815 [Hyphomicrobiales bacterium]
MQHQGCSAAAPGIAFGYGSLSTVVQASAVFMAAINESVVATERSMWRPLWAILLASDIGRNC